jgi:hypothetical protein
MLLFLSSTLKLWLRGKVTNQKQIPFLRKESKMNLYFLSLLKPEKRREKNIANVYQVGTVRLGPERNLESRFPFLEKGDIIKYEDSIYISGGGRGQFPSHPYFYSYYSGYIMYYLSEEYKSHLSLANLQIQTSTIGQSTNRMYFVSKFKLGKRKYNISMIPRIHEPGSYLLNLERKIRNRNQCTIINPGIYEDMFKIKLFLEFH